MEIEKKKVTDSNIKQEELVNKFDISGFGFRNGSDLKKKIETLAKKEELKAEQDELVKVEKYDLSYFLSKKLLDIGGFPKMFVYQEHLVRYSYKKTKTLIMLSIGNQKYCMLLLFHQNIFFSCIAQKLFGYKIEIKFKRDSLFVEHNKYASKIANANNVSELQTWPKNSLENFIFKNCLLSATNNVKNNHKGKWVYSSDGIPFDEMNLWTFGNDFARNVVIFGVDDSSSSRSDNRKNNFLILGDINDSFGSLEKKY